MKGIDKVCPIARGMSGGFTLIEVMVTLTVLAFILLMIFGVFRLGLSAWEKGDSIKDEYQVVRIASQIISRQVKSLVPYKIKSQKAEGDYLAFEGKAHSLKFVSALPLRAKQPEGFVYAVYAFREGEKEGGRLVFYEQRVLNRDFMEDKPKDEASVSLFAGISEVRFAYYQEENPEKNQVAAWVEEWDAKEKGEIPKAIRVTLIPKEKKGDSPFNLLVSLPSNRFEEVRTAPSRRVIPSRPLGTGR